jgi:predicted component of type VI protein secretion system
VDVDLADILVLFSRHWLLLQVGPQQAAGWVQRAEAVVRMLSLRGEHRGQRDLRDGVAHEGDRPMVTLVLRGLPRGAQPVEVEVDLADGAIIGRAENCDWVLPGEVVSRQHARLRYDLEKHAFFVSNLSRNGLGIDDDTVLTQGEAEVNVGTVLKIPKEGHYVILVQSVFIPVSSLSMIGISAALDAPVPLDGDDDADAIRALDDDDPMARASDTGAHAPVPSSDGERGDVIDMAAFMQRDPKGVVIRLLEQYHFVTPEAAEPIRRYVYAQQDAEEAVQALFADVLTAAPRL